MSFNILLFLPQVGARCLSTGVYGAIHNVEINLKQISDQTYRQQVQEQCKTEVAKADQFCREILAVLDGRE